MKIAYFKDFALSKFELLKPLFSAYPKRFLIIGILSFVLITETSIAIGARNKRIAPQNIKKIANTKLKMTPARPTKSASPMPTVIDEAAIIPENVIAYPTQPPTRTIKVSVTGTLYADKNCNGVMDNDEKGITTATTIDLYKRDYSSFGQTTSSDGKGNFAVYTTLLVGEEVTFTPNVYITPGLYIFNYHYGNPEYTANSQNTNINFNFPLVPEEDMHSCERPFVTQ